MCEVRETSRQHGRPPPPLRIQTSDFELGSIKHEPPPSPVNISRASRAKIRGKVSPLGLIVRDHKPASALQQTPAMLCIPSPTSSKDVMLPASSVSSVPSATSEEIPRKLRSLFSPLKKLVLGKTQTIEGREAQSPEPRNVSRAQYEVDSPSSEDERASVLDEEYLQIVHALRRHGQSPSPASSSPEVFPQLERGRAKLASCEASPSSEYATAISTRNSSLVPTPISMLRPSWPPNAATSEDWSFHKIESDQGSPPAAIHNRVDSAIAFEAEPQSHDNLDKGKAPIRKDLPLQLKAEKEARKVEVRDPSPEPPKTPFVVPVADPIEIARREAELQELMRVQEEIAAQEHEAERLARLRDCVVCGDQKEPLEFSATPPTKRCKHPVQTCTECLQSWLAAELTAKGCNAIKCSDCKEVLEYHEVAESASNATFQQYDQLSARQVLGQLEDFSWCLGKECNNGQVNLLNNNYMLCLACNYEQCLHHKIPWHKDETCAQYDLRKANQGKTEEEKKTEAWIKTETKACPNAKCGWRIQKAEGCDHMTCRKCRHEFCWKCSASQKEIRRVGNTAHQPECPYHSDKLDLAWPFNAH